MIIYDKFFCNHYEKVFDFKNKLYNYIRNKKYQQSLIKSKFVNKMNLTSLFTFETIFNDANIIIIKTKLKYFTHITITFTFVAKSIASYKFNLLTFVFIESIAFKVTIIIKLFL